MYIISCRLNFDDPDRLSMENHVRKINLFEESPDFDARENTKAWAEFEKVVEGKTVLILVHGYNNETYEVYDSYNIIEQNVHANLADQYDLIIGYSWPGGDQVFEWWSAKKRSNAVARLFRFALKRLLERCKAVDIMSHSLGARIVLKALKEYQEPSPRPRNYYCLAAAVDNEALEEDEEFNDSVSQVEKLFVFHSVKDKRLSIAYRAAEFDRALGLSGPEDINYVRNRLRNTYVINCKHVIQRHGDYKRSRSMYDYILKILQGKKVNRFITLY